MTVVKVFVAIAIIAFFLIVVFGFAKDIKLLIQKKKAKKIQSTKEEVSDKDASDSY